MMVLQGKTSIKPYRSMQQKEKSVDIQNKKVYNENRKRQDEAVMPH